MSEDAIFWFTIGYLAGGGFMWLLCRFTGLARPAYKERPNDD